MRISAPLPAALCAALGLATALPAPADARSPIAIEGADHEMREAILDLLPDRPAPTTLFEAERISEEAAARAMAWLRSEGYYEAEVTPQATENPVAARLVIAPGRRFRFAAPDLTFDGTRPEPAAAAAAQTAIEALAPNAPARAAQVLQAEGAAVTALQEAGYADAVAGARQVIVDHATGEVSVHYVLHAGAFARLGAVHAEPRQLFRQSFVNRLRNWTVGQPYAPEHLARLRRDLLSTGAVAQVSTQLEAPNAEGVRDVLLEVEPSKRNAYEFGLGYSTTEGGSVDAQWTRRNITHRADSLTFATTLGELQQSASVELTRPHAAGLGHARHFLAQVSHEDTKAFSRQGVTLSAYVGAEARLRQALTYGVALSYNTYDQAAGVNSATVLSGFADWRHDSTGAPLDPRHGHIYQLRLEPSASLGSATLGFVRATAETRLYHSIGRADAITFAARGRVGWLAPVSGNADDAPPDRRFYAGGGGSVRGYAYNSIYPHERDALGLTPGGQGLLEVSGEARFRVAGGWGAAAFVDGGNAFDDWSRATDLSWGAGVGVRYDLGFAPLRADIAVPLNRRPGDESYALYISLGQAF